MTVRGFDVFDQMVAAAAVPPQAPPATPQPVAATATTISFSLSLIAFTPLYGFMWNVAAL